jgi:hypothetical protein
MSDATSRHEGTVGASAELGLRVLWADAADAEVRLQCCRAEEWQARVGCGTALMRPNGGGLRPGGDGVL